MFRFPDVPILRAPASPFFRLAGVSCWSSMGPTARYSPIAGCCQLGFLAPEKKNRKTLCHPQLPRDKCQGTTLAFSPEASLRAEGCEVVPQRAERDLAFSP